MTQLHLNGSTTTGSHDSPIYVALELSGRNWLVGILVPPGNKISEHSVAPGDGAGLLALLGRVRAKAARKLDRSVGMVSTYEAGGDGFWLHRLLRNEGIENHVMDPSSIQVNRRARRAKTDRIDLAGLLRTLLAWCRGEPRVCSMVRVPSVAAEDDKRLLRERERLVKERVAHTNRIGGLLATQGIRDFRALGKNSETLLEGLVSGDGRSLPPGLKADIVRELRRLRLVQADLREVEAERDQLAAQASKAKEPTALGMLMRLKGIGSEFASALTHEVFYRDFANRRCLAGYLGLTPSPYASGRMQREQGISKAGNKRMRRTMVLLTWRWLQWQPESALSLWFKQRVGEVKGRLRRIMIIALARKLLIALWRYVETGLVPDGAIMKA